MRRRDLLLALLPARALPRTLISPDVDSADLLKFHHHYNLYERHFFGCDVDTMSMRDCKSEHSTRDYANWQACRSLAAKIFRLRLKD